MNNKVAGYIEKVVSAVHANDGSIGMPHSILEGWHSPDELLFRDADGDHFSAAWRGGLVIDEAPFASH
jgi:hypothetical protein